MTEGIVLSASLFTGEPIEEYIVLNQAAIDEAKSEAEAIEILNSNAGPDEEPLKVPTIPKPQGAWFTIIPVDGDLDSEYTKRRGQDSQTARYHLNQNSHRDDDEPRVKMEALERTFSNSKEIAARKWLAEKVVFGWRGIKLSSGDELEFSGKNLAKMSSIPKFIMPVIRRAYELNEIINEASEGN